MIREIKVFITEENLKLMTREEIELEYNNLIDNSRCRGLDKSKYSEYFLEKHHIIPHCLGGNDEDENLVLLTVREHIYAHLYLYYMNPKNTALELTLNWMIPSRKSKGLISDEDIENRKKIWTAQAYRKVSIVGSREREDYRKLQSKLNSDRLKNPAARQKVSEGVLAITDRSKFKQRSRRVISDDGTVYQSIGDCAKHFGLTHGAIRWRILNNKGLNYLDEPVCTGHKVEGPDGTIYKSLRECSKKTSYSRRALRDWIANHPEKGFKYI